MNARERRTRAWELATVLCAVFASACSLDFRRFAPADAGVDRVDRVDIVAPIDVTSRDDGADVPDVPRDIPPMVDAVCGSMNQPCCGATMSCNTGLGCVIGLCTCGTLSAPCCGGITCNAALVCSGRVCLACGAVAQPCCAGSTCGANSECRAGTCVRCGTPGEPCCTAGAACSGGAVCGPSGRCGPCGGVGDPCCGGTCDPSTAYCSTGTDTCVACGALGEPCCDGSLCRSTYCDTRADPRGHCIDCGGPGQPCCGTPGCATGLSCINPVGAGIPFCSSATANVAGGPCDTVMPMCLGDSVCRGYGYCIPCGGYGQFCCPPSSIGRCNAGAGVCSPYLSSWACL